MCACMKRCIVHMLSMGCRIHVKVRLLTADMDGMGKLSNAYFLLIRSPSGLHSCLHGLTSILAWFV